MAESGTVVALRRYPVKSMLGEDLGPARLTASGLAGDRVAAVIDVETGRDFVPASSPMRLAGKAELLPAGLAPQLAAQLPKGYL